MSIDGWPGHRAGQHVDVRLTAEDGFQAERSYSLASPPEQPTIAITVERIEDGEVSPYLAGELRVGDQFELRGPIGGYFAWTVEDGGPIFLAGGGSGLVPLMAMVRHRAARRSTVSTVLLVSARSSDRLIYGKELSRLATSPNTRIAITLTRDQPPGWQGYDRRVDAMMLAELLPEDLAPTRAFVCGPNAFVEGVAELLVATGASGERIRTERFGPTGS